MRAKPDEAGALFTRKALIRLILPLIVEQFLAVAVGMEMCIRDRVGECVRSSVRDLRAFVPQGDSGVVLCNPPYGERLLDVRAAEGLYRLMGQVFQPKKGWTYAVISPHEEFETLFGRKADKRRKLYNGMLKCQLYIYYRA